MNDTTKALVAAALEFAKALVWPLFLAWLFLRFRMEVAALLKRLGSVKVAGSEFVFQGSSAKSEELVAAGGTTSEVQLQPGPDGFLSQTTVRRIVDLSGLLDQGDASMAALLLFQSPEQRTWIVVTTAYAFLVLDDEETRKEKRLIQTFFAKSLLLPIKAESNQGAPVVRFAAEETWWYYTEGLFPNPRMLEAALRKLLYA